MSSVTTPTAALESLVDPVCGIVRRVKEVRRPDRAPAAYVSLTAEVSDARRLGDWPADRVSLGTTFGDPVGAWIAAVAEGVERYCGNFIPGGLDPERQRVGSRRDLVAAGLPVIELEALPRWAAWQREDPDFPYTVLDEDTPTLWVCCTDTRGRPRWWPASLVHLNWRQRRFRHLPRVHHLNYAGIATGQGAADAADRGLLEVVERDAMETWWRLGGQAGAIDPASVPGLADAMAGCELQYWVVQMPSEFAPAMAALVLDPVTGVYAAGFSASVEPATAARKAVLEAVHTWIYTQGCTDADGWVFQAVDAGLMAPGLHLEHRADRRYLDSAGPLQEHVRDLGAHVQVWLDPRTHHLAQRFTDPGNPPLPISEVERTDVGTVRSRLAAAGHEIYTCDLTTRDVATTGLSVVRTLVTGLVPNAPAAFAYLGMDRFPQVALARGWRTEIPSRPEDFTLVPSPHM